MECGRVPLLELYTGRFHRPATTIRCSTVIQDSKGRFPKRMLVRAVFAPKHFDAEGPVEHDERDAVTGAERVVKIRCADKPTRDLY